MLQPTMNRPTLPWWRVPAAWLVVGGPALVVVAGFVTLAIALKWGDPPLQKSASDAAEEHTPAVQARNHVVTPRR